MEENKIEKLLDEFSEQRDSLKLMIADLEQMKEKISSIFPEKVDQRYLAWFQEKVKTVTEFYKAILDMRKEITKSLKDEIDLRHKIGNKNSLSEDDILEMMDLHSVAKRMQSLENKSKAIKKEGEKIDE